MTKQQFAEVQSENWLNKISQERAQNHQQNVRAHTSFLNRELQHVSIAESFDNVLFENETSKSKKKKKKTIFYLVNI